MPTKAATQSRPIIPWMGGKRRLAKHLLPLFPDHSCYIVSTHSRSKAAATNRAHDGTDNRGFNSQPLEGGCASSGIAMTTS